MIQLVLDNLPAEPNFPGRMINVFCYSQFSWHLQMPHACYASAEARVGNPEPITVLPTRVASQAVRKEFCLSMTTTTIPLTPSAAETTPTDGETTPLPPSPTRTRYQQVADQFLRAFNAASALLPNLETPHATTVNFVRGHTNAPPKFLATVTWTVEQLPELSALGKLDPDTHLGSQSNNNCARVCFGNFAVFPSKESCFDCFN